MISPHSFYQINTPQAEKLYAMVSCNPSTAARDIKFLCENGYKAVKGRAVDMFPRTAHVECVVKLKRK